MPITLDPRIKRANATRNRNRATYDVLVGLWWTRQLHDFHVVEEDTWSVQHSVFGPPVDLSTADTKTFVAAHWSADTQQAALDEARAVGHKLTTVTVKGASRVDTDKLRASAVRRLAKLAAELDAAGLGASAARVRRAGEGVAA